MNSFFSFKGNELVQNFSIDETLTPHEHIVCEYSPSLKVLIFAITIYLVLVTFGNFLLLCMITYEQFGMDSKKRTATNQLLSSICRMLIGYNIMFMTVQTINVLKIQSKICHCRLYVQFPKINIVPLVNKPYVNEVTLTGKNPPLKYC